MKVLPKLFAVLLALFLIFLVSGTAFAAPKTPTLSGNQYNGTWPNQTPCATGATTVLSAPVKNGSTTIGLVELRWSASCGTNWTRVTSYIGNTNIFSQIERNSGPDGGYLIYCNPQLNPCSNADTFNFGTAFFTPQVWSPDNAARAKGWITQGGSTFSACVVNPPWSC